VSRGCTLLPLAGCALVLAACGGGGGSSGTGTTSASAATLVTPGLQPPAGCYVTVFLIEAVTKAQITQLQKLLLANRLISQVSFVPKALELKRFAQTNPVAAKGMHLNPFADRFEVVPRTHGSVFSIVGDFATSGGPITNVKPSTGCG
jgi:FtsX-like permease family protein